MVGAWQRIVENHDDTVAHEPLESSLVADDLFAETGMILGKNRHDLFGLGGLGEGGKAAQIAEDDGHLATVALQERVSIARRNDEVGDLLGQEPPEPAPFARSPSPAPPRSARASGSSRKVARPGPQGVGPGSRQCREAPSGAASSAPAPAAPCARRAWSDSRRRRRPAPRPRRACRPSR